MSWSWLGSITEVYAFLRLALAMSNHLTGGAVRNESIGNFGQVVGADASAGLEREFLGS